MASIIKAATSHQPGAIPPLKSFQFDDMGTAYVARVRAEAARLIVEAKSEAARIKAQAKKEAHQAAVDEVQAAFRTRLDQQLASLLTALGVASQQIIESRQAWQMHWEQRIVQLAAAMASRLCRRELSRQPHISADWIREALTLAAGSGTLVVRLNPGDRETLGPQVEAIAKRVGGVGTVRVESDEAVSAGGCVVETEFGSLDQQLESQLARLTEELLDA